MVYSANLNALLTHYATYNGSRFIDEESVLSVIKHGIRNGFLVEVEQKNPYTFGGVTVPLTDSELASVLTELTNRRKITAIKAIRKAGNITLQEAKAFADHLGDITSKMDNGRIPDC